MCHSKLKKKLPVGIESFKKIRTDNFYYIDKTGLISELLNNWGEVNLFTRPRRFGKSLNMDMLKNFFEIGCDPSLFNGLAISREKNLCEAYMGRFPVLSISLKDVEGKDYITARSMLSFILKNEALRFYFLLNSERLNPADKNTYRQLIAIDEDSPDALLISSLRTLSRLLQKHYDQSVIILIDEYDVPLAKASEQGYYDEMVSLLRGLLSHTLKTNASLHFAVMTGCLRIAKESIFTGLNNLRTMTILDVNFDEYFGFTDEEVKTLLAYYDLSETYPVVKDWYDGYRFGNTDVYCPWDVLCYCDKRRFNKNMSPGNYWSNTSSNDIIRHFLEMANPSTRRDIEKLIAGEAVTKEIRQELTYKELYDSLDNVWSVLFTTGYLTLRGEPDGDWVQLIIPNMEIKKIFINQISQWTQVSARQNGAALAAFCEAFRNADTDAIEAQLNHYLSKTISIRDTASRNTHKENFYHGLLLGLLNYRNDWYVISNRESGDGYSDILVEIEDESIGMVIELKYANNGNLSAACREAMTRIENKGYIHQLQEDGMQTILKYGIACYKKKCQVTLAKPEL